MRRHPGSAILVLAASVAAAAFAVTAAPVRADAGRWWSHVKVLADDDLEGRGTGTRGHQRAVEYVAAQFARAGLEPAGTDGFFQPVAFEQRRIVEDRSSLALERDGRREPLVLGEDAYLNLRADPLPTLDAPLVFVGYGFAVPEAKFDELAGVDLKGAIAVYLGGGPSNIPGALRAHYQSAGERWAALKKAGAVGILTIPNPRGMEIPWSRMTVSRLEPALVLADASLDDRAGQRLAVTVNPARAEKLFAGSGHTFADLLALADRGAPLPKFRLPGRLHATVAAERSKVTSSNVVGVLRGSDPARRNEYVALSAHVDHLGVGGAIDGDGVYNGVMDNASGTAALLEIASQLKESGARGARSLLFVVVTAEEQGELGSKYFAAHPTVPAASIVADVNTDMFLPLFPLKTLMVLGLDESDLGADIRAVASSRGIAVQADPEPGRNRFIRSDQYSFIRAGIPSLAMKVGYEPGSPEASIALRWTNERYHAPSDDLAQPIDLDAAAGYVDVVAALARRIADRPGRPAWNPASFFRRFVSTS